MDTVKVLDGNNDPVSDVTVSRVHMTRSMLPEEAITNQNGIAKFEYKMCISDDFNCWIHSTASRQNKTTISELPEVEANTTIILTPEMAGHMLNLNKNRYTIEDDSSLTFIINKD